MFQEMIIGADLRVHVLDGKTWSIAVDEKDAPDYRYATTRSQMRSVEIPELINTYCQNLCEQENNRFMGIDFLVRDDEYYCLEANPGPGWNFYGTIPDPINGFLKYKILKTLCSADAKKEAI